MVPRGMQNCRRCQVETLPTCSELAMTEFGRFVAERMGWTVPSLDSASSILDFMRESAAFQRKIEDWAKANPGEAAELRQHAAEEATRKHEDRISERLQERADARASSAPRKLAAFLSAIGVGDVTRDAVVGSLEDTTALRAVKEWTKTGGILLLLGSKGTGKTTAAAWGLSMLGVTTWPRCFCDRCRGGGPSEDCFVGAGHRARVADEELNPTKARFVKAGHLAAALHRPGGDATWDEVRKVYALAIDDLGREYSDQHGRWQAERDLVIDDRHERRLPTGITSNLSPEEFRQRYGERIADRIRQMGLVVLCVGESLRRNRA